MLNSYYSHIKYSCGAESRDLKKIYTPQGLFYEVNLPEGEKRLVCPDGTILGKDWIEKAKDLVFDPKEYLKK